MRDLLSALLAVLSAGALEAVERWRSGWVSVLDGRAAAGGGGYNQ